MTPPIHESAQLVNETLIPLREASPHFPAAVSRNWLEKMIRTGTRGVKLETFFFCNKRYTSKEAIARFLENTQNTVPPQNMETVKYKRRTEAELEAELRRLGLSKPGMNGQPAS